MEIEIFDDLELRELQDESERRTHQAIASRLQLDRQLTYSVADTPMPYAEADNFTRAVYATVFDTVRKLAEYDKPVPNRILMLVQIGVENGWWTTDDLYVRYSGTMPDPILCRKPEGAGDYSERMVIIARWGDALLPFPDLVRAAAAKTAATVRQKVRAKIAELEAVLADPEAAAIEHLQAGRTGYYV